MRAHLFMIPLFVHLVVSSQLFAQSFAVSDPGFGVCSNSAAAWADIDNDGDLDVFFTGLDENGVALAHLYRNDGGGIFTALTTAITGVYLADCEFGDMNNDGFADLAVSGYTGSQRLSIIYRNDGGGVFTDIVAGLTGLSSGSLSWGDYDNDGLSDLLISGTDDSMMPHTVLYHNEGGEVFAEAGAGLTALSESSLAWADLDLDGDKDIALAGKDENGLPQSILYINDQGVFSMMGAGLTGLWGASLGWGDYNNDTYPDLLLSGADNNGVLQSLIYKNLSGASFSLVGGSFTGIVFGSSVWGDFDNDGDLDFLLSGQSYGIGTPSPAPELPLLNLYLNLGNDQFSLNEIQLPAPDKCSVVCGDYDNDDDLDLLMAGFFNAPVGADEGSAMIYRNEASQGNNPPAAPTGLGFEFDGFETILHWNASADDKTPSSGLNYNVRIGTQQDNMDILSALADLTDGYHRIVRTGNGSGDTTCTIHGLEIGEYYTSVQALDHNYAASLFSQDMLLIIPPVAHFDLTDSLCVFEQTFVTYTGNASPSAQYIWDFDGGMILSGSGQGPIEVYWFTEGIKTVTLTVIQSGITSAPGSQQVVISGFAPAPGDISGETELCQGAQTSEYSILPLPGVIYYDWRLYPNESGDIIGNLPTANVEWAASFSGNAYIIVRGINACGSGPFSDSLVVIVDPLPGKPDIPEGPADLCLNSPNTEYYTAGAMHGNAYQWYLTPETSGLIFGSGLEAEVDWDNEFSGVAGIVVKSFNDCGEGPYSDTLFVYINQPPDVDAGEDQVIPSGTSTQLHGSATGGSGSYSYAWSPSEFLVDTTVQEPFTVDLDQIKQFTLLVIDELTSCSSQDQVAISVSGGELGVEVYAEPEQLCQGEESQLLALAGGGTGVYTYSWTSQPAGFTSDIPDPLVSPMENTNYYAEVSDGNGIVSDSIMLTVFPLPGDAGPLIGADEVCAGDELILYETDPLPFATQYYWTLPSGAYGESDSSAIYVSFTQIATSGEINVIPINDCGQGEPSAMYVDVKYVPGIPETPQGPDTMCTTTDTIATYILEEAVVGALFYEWRLLPEEAGTILGDGLSATIHWTYNWEGMAAVSVRAVNDCGPSAWATPFPVYTYNSLGLADENIDHAYLKLFPNPVKRVLSVEPFDKLRTACWVLNDQKELVLSVWDIYGRKLKDIEIPTGQKQLQFNVSSFPEGLYILILHDQHRVLANEKFVVIR